MIEGRTPREAAAALRDVVQAALSCVTTGVVTNRPVGVANDLVLVQRLTTNSGAVVLALRHRYFVTHDADAGRPGRWQARTSAYEYKLDAADGREILAYHWHPASRGHEHRPHLHLGAGLGTIRPEWQKSHLRTGHVSPAALLFLLIDHLHALPRLPDWPVRFDRLDAALAPVWSLTQTWGARHGRERPAHMAAGTGPLNDCHSALPSFRQPCYTRAVTAAGRDHRPRTRRRCLPPL